MAGYSVVWLLIMRQTINGDIVNVLQIGWYFV